MMRIKMVAVHGSFDGVLPARSVARSDKSSPALQHAARLMVPIKQRYDAAGWLFTHVLLDINANIHAVEAGCIAGIEAYTDIERLTESDFHLTFANFGPNSETSWIAFSEVVKTLGPARNHCGIFLCFRPDRMHETGHRQGHVRLVTRRPDGPPDRNAATRQTIAVYLASWRGAGIRPKKDSSTQPLSKTVDQQKTSGEADAR